MIQQMAILTDVTKCIGCEECVKACKDTYNLEADRPRRHGLQKTLGNTREKS